jgi:hypothetical protein
MDQVALVEDPISDGQKLLVQLAQDEFEVTGACWLKTSEDEKWFLYIASPIVDKEGPRQAYRRVSGVLRSAPQPLSIKLSDVKVVGAETPLAESLRDFYRRYPRTTPVRHEVPRFGDLNIDDAFIYPPISTVDQTVGDSATT